MDAVEGVHGSVEASPLMLEPAIHRGYQHQVKRTRGQTVAP